MFALTLRYAAAMIQTDSTTVHLGDCLAVLRSDTLGYEWELGYAPPLIPDNSMDAVVTDPPYGLEFMGKEWDGADGFRRSLNPNDTGRDNAFGRTSRTSPQYCAGALFQEWCEAWVTECLRVLKPGGHLLAFGGSRTWHRLAVAVEDAGFEVRDSIAWLYGSGFPKSLDVSKAIDKAAPRVGMPAGFAAHIKERREALGLTQKDVAAHFPSKSGGLTGCVWNWENGANVPTPEQWEILAGVLGIHHGMWETLIDRVEAERQVIGSRTDVATRIYDGGEGPRLPDRIDITAPATPAAQQWQGWGTALKPAFEPIVVARKPLVGTVAANVLAHGTGALNIDGCRVAHDEPAGKPSTGMHGRRAGIMGETIERHRETTSASTAGRWPANVVLDESQAEAFEEARFFYVPKAATRERPKVDGIAHPTVKPLALMRWLVRLVTPPGGTVLEPFAGSGTTVEACALEGFACIAIEREPDYLPLIQARLARVEAAQPEPAGPSLFDMENTA